MARRMSEPEWRAFLMHGTRTGKLATVRADGRPHVVPVWFVLDGDDIVFSTGGRSVKGRDLLRTGAAAICVDDPHPPFAFVTVAGAVTISEDLDELGRWATVIGARYMGERRGAEFGARNTAPGELLVRLRAEHVLAEADLVG
jgi:PPOX class probable F420-dependent enzyme